MNVGMNQRRAGRLLAALSLAASLMPLTSHAADCAAQGPSSPGELAREWILVGWEKKKGDPPLDFRAKLGKYYDWSSGGQSRVFYDDFEPQKRVVGSPGEYGAIWEPLFTALRSAQHRLAFGPQVWLSDQLAATTLQFVARLEAADGKVTGIRTHASLVWTCTADGWKIVREHNSSVVLPTGAIDAMFPAE